MSSFTPLHCKPSLWVTSLLGGAILMSCASMKQPESQSLAPGAGNAPTSESSVAQPVADNAATATAQVPQAAPQLVKTAELVLTVDSIEASLQTATHLIKQQQGDLLGLQDQNPRSDRVRHFATLQIRVPQAKLDLLLAELTKLGTVQTRSLDAEDVSAQLVDLDARLRNLRKTEQTLLKIMERSGSVGDVLKVAQEVSKTRESIEQIAAQFEHLKNQVAYSTITLRLEQAVSSTPPQTALGSQFQETWQQATHSVSSLTIGLLKLGLWLIAYTPYLLVLVVGGVWLYRQKRRPRIAASPEPTNSRSEGDL